MTHSHRTTQPPAGYALVKRSMDIALAGLGLILGSGVMLAVAIAIRLDTPGPVLFAQRRIGRNSDEFVILKFRSMAVGTPDLATHLVEPGALEVTRVGRFIRRTSLDELPQLWNILRGDMTLVGPRPALHNQLDLAQMRRDAGVDALKPGLTGLAQISGRDDLTMAEKVAFDREYLERMSLLFDVRVLLLTARHVVGMRGAR